MSSKRNRIATALGLIGIVVIAGCEGLPSSPEADVGQDAYAVDPAVASAVDESWDFLVPADEIRGLDPEARARHFVGAAFRLLEHAKDLAGPDPRPEIAEALREAEDHCETARRALDQGDWQLAVREARACANLARRVIGVLSDGVSDDTLADRAEQAVAHAKDLLERAHEMAGDDPRPEIEALLGRARNLIGEADAALEAEDWREAIRLAREAALVLQRVIRLLS